MAHAGEGQLPGYQRVRRAEGVLQHLPGADEAHVLVLGGDGEGVGVRVDKVEEDALGLARAADAPHRHGQGELLLEFAHEAVRRGLALFDFAAGEFPQVGVVAPLAPLADENPALAVMHDAGGYFDHKRLLHAG